MTSPEGLTMIVPAFNEEGSIGDVIDDLARTLGKLEIPSEIIVVDDGSTDGTAAILSAQAGIRFLRHTENLGYGASLKRGIREASYPWIGITDGDGTYPGRHLPDLLEHRDGHDMVVGARTGEKVHIPAVRRPAKWFLRRLACYLSGRDIKDLNSGFRIMRRRVLERFVTLLPDGFSFTSTVTLAFLCNGYGVTYVPIDYEKRVGRSKIRPVYDTLNFLQLVIRMALYFEPLRIFAPMSLVLFAMGSGLLLYRIFVETAFVTTIIILFLTAFQILAIGMLADLIDKRIR